MPAPTTSQFTVQTIIMRLTGKHETASIDSVQFTGVADRGASIRVPHSFVNNGYKGYLEDRRLNSQGDPYQIASQILKTIASVPTGSEQVCGGLISRGSPCSRLGVGLKQPGKGRCRGGVLADLPDLSRVIEKRKKPR